jgi:hypothetical protein
MAGISVRSYYDSIRNLLIYAYDSNKIVFWKIDLQFCFGQLIKQWCLTCSEYGEQTKCTSCQSGFTLKDEGSGEGRCMKDCPAGEYGDIGWNGLLECVNCRAKI